MKTALIKGLEKDAADVVKEEFARALPLRERLIQVLDEKRDARHRASLMKSNYENSAWAFSQADDIGYMRALNEIIELLK